MDRRLESYRTTQLITEIINFMGAPLAFCFQLFFTSISISMNIEADKTFDMNIEIFIFCITLLSIVILVALGIASFCTTRSLVKLQKNNASSEKIDKGCKSLLLLRTISLITAVIGLISIIITLCRGSFDGKGFNYDYAFSALACFLPVWFYFIVESILTLITFIKCRKTLR